MPSRPARRSGQPGAQVPSRGLQPSQPGPLGERRRGENPAGPEASRSLRRVLFSLPLSAPQVAPQRPARSGKQGIGEKRTQKVRDQSRPVHCLMF